LQCNSSRSFLHLDAAGLDQLAPLFPVAAHAAAGFFVNVSSLCRAMQFSFFCGARDCKRVDRLDKPSREENNGAKPH
jgi:hypothetical protein